MKDKILFASYCQTFKMFHCLLKYMFNVYHKGPGPIDFFLASCIPHIAALADGT